MTEGPEVRAAKRLLDAAKDHGFAFARIAPGEDGPLMGVRESIEFVDRIYLGGFSSGTWATRQRRSSLVVPGGLPVTERVSGDALTVLHAVVTGDWTRECDR